ncbi:uncharacterized protein MONOS_4372 [Monocercomonoides exilis]|uniref:uncharacterized protein n=1 Tax=Monocercomonoides exilis TaxID=2049356 RepID=UPI003559C187|nr:hypothetical protein MONOS_4372 [Monocercomonoides exilis]|eukprot:MONOS_4372.1-p1 / transcript=MONOS_4372.1 / gene=MONOS_4372 / organism=Monocercomonoides_exilis_PA203 / gene_product=unspecified product / transcript_product=unspecified product / location=Mono_scaffold00115:88388-89420(+) / protein_length=302 / sequence_SO=supercontig / SO=protein_coding / is_pseudo=false
MTSLSTVSVHQGPSEIGYEFIDKITNEEKSVDATVHQAIITTELQSILSQTRKLAETFDSACNSINEKINHITRFIDSADFRLSGLREEIPFYEESIFRSSFYGLSHCHVTTIKLLEEDKSNYFNSADRLPEVQNLLDVADATPDISKLNRYVSSLPDSEINNNIRSFALNYTNPNCCIQRWINSFRTHLGSSFTFNNSSNQIDATKADSVLKSSSSSTTSSQSKSEENNDIFISTLAENPLQFSVIPKPTRASVSSALVQPHELYSESSLTSSTIGNLCNAYQSTKLAVQDDDGQLLYEK